MGRPSDREYFYSVNLDSKNSVLGVNLVSQGSLDNAVIHPRKVYKPAILSSAASLVFVHNHPSGNPEPSQSDRGITKALLLSGELLGFNILDHVIIGRHRFYSFADSGELESYKL